MTLTEEQKQRIAEEEDYRAKIREESKKSNKKVCSGCLIFFLLIIVLVAVSLIKINPEKQFEQAGKAKLSVVTPIPAIDIVNKTEDEIKTTYAPVYANYSDTGLTPSGKVKITGFDITNVKVQIDYVVDANKPVYIGYTFTPNPLEEETAWKVTGISKPTADSTSNPGIMNRTVHVWENIPEIEPFKLLTAISESDGKVSGISFSTEDLATMKSNHSVYYVPQSL